MSSCHTHTHTVSHHLEGHIYTKCIDTSLPCVALLRIKVKECYFDFTDIIIMFTVCSYSLESVSGWLRAQEPHRNSGLDDQYLDEEPSPVKEEVATLTVDLTDVVIIAHVQLAASRRRPRENIPWYAADYTDGPLLLREEDEEEEPPPYEVTLTQTPRKTSTQSTVSDVYRVYSRHFRTTRAYPL